ncbi:potassium transporter Trk [Peptostreptococcus sp. MV1]|uniref:potassium channel family protein n=1 Tax=Peptostreptococcus sp. MV1 TaxID=1219626 RepID=UPI00050F9552|nr:TrkA family potassium uptake protein [Peptostreptococcus sp. MV1]KGF15238.1 potassium transporter Trk [Peptostreptococcus sp. MV1]
MKQFIVVGGGRFGESAAKALTESGQEVMVVDIDEDVIQQISGEVESTAILDVTDEQAMNSIGLNNFDVAIIAIGGELRASIMATLIAKEAGIPLVISRAKDSLQANVLKKIGADRVVFPESDMGVKIAKALTFDNVVDFMQLDETHSVFEVTVPKLWVGSNLIDLMVRKKYNINVVGVKRGETFQVPPSPSQNFEDGDIIVIAGQTKVIEEIALLVSSDLYVKR